LTSEGKELTHRERWVRTMHFEPVDHVPDEEFGYWAETFTAWHEQGLPRWVDSNPMADLYFRFAPRHMAPVNVGLLYWWEEKVLSEDERHIVKVNAGGVHCMVLKDGSSSIPKYIRFPLESREDWEREFLPRLAPAPEQRYPANWPELVEQYRRRDYPLGISVGSIFGWIRDWMGFENSTMCFYDDPGLMREMMQTLTDLTCSTIERALRDVQFDFAHFWEDMAYKAGPMISPALFDEYMVPCYARITSLLRQHGVDIVIVDCDGNINELVGLWLKGGVNVMFPLEIRGGSDPRPIRDRYGKSVLLMGGVDKTRLIEGPAAIDAELERIAPLVEEGGYIPHVDHRCPPDVTLENYRYYLRAKRERFGIPQPDPVELTEPPA